MKRRRCGTQRRPGRHDVVHDEDACTVQSGTGHEDRSGESLAARAAGLWLRAVSVEETPARHAQLTRDGTSEHLALVEPSLSPTFGTRGRPGDDVDVVMCSLREQAIHDQPGEVPTHRAPVAILQPEHDAARPAGERHRGEDTV